MRNLFSWNLGATEAANLEKWSLLTNLSLRLNSSAAATLDFPLSASSLFLSAPEPPFLPLGIPFRSLLSFFCRLYLQCVICVALVTWPPLLLSSVGSCSVRFVSDRRHSPSASST
ncbi:hypothetical protein BJX64DRAFT_73006 [Aspergillus heterothallicus]